MRGLSPEFMQSLKSGFLAEIPRAVRCDHDLNLEIRDGYLNIYFKGYSILKLDRAGAKGHKVTIDPAFRAGLDLPPCLSDEETTAAFVHALPQLKQNVIRHGRISLELEYEQMLIRANNYEPRNNSEYFIVDRQYALAEGRFDLTGFLWPRRGRHKRQEVSLCLMEVKSALNPDISEVDRQLARYYNALLTRAEKFAAECETVFKQKLELGLYDQATNRLEAMKTLSFSSDIETFKFILVLLDYNPNSGELDLSRIAALPFADQISVFPRGFAMWEQELIPVKAYMQPAMNRPRHQ